MALFDLMGRRWAITVIWGLRGGAKNFRDLQTSTPGITTSVLNTRLRELREAGLVTHGPSGYDLTDIGRTLLAAADPLVAWTGTWATSLEAADT